MKKTHLDSAALDRLKLALTSLAKASGLNLCMLDILGRTLIYPTNDCALCKLVRSDSTGRANCIRFASHSVLEAAREQRVFFYKCPYGLVDFAVPVYYEKEFIGAICGGQVRSSESESRMDFVYPPVAPEDMCGKDEAIARIYSLMPDLPAERVFETAELIRMMASSGLDRINTFIAISEKAEDEQSAARLKLRPALAYIEDNFVRHISAKDMAQLCCISENYFSRLFGKLIGTTLPKYVTALRLSKAKELLRAPDAKIHAVAYQVGYDDPAYFNRKFKAYTGMTPTEWQQADRSAPSAGTNHSE